MTPQLGSPAVLERMDEIDWGVLEHAYGPAKDVPESIRALASPDADEREKARHTLYGNIFHQGTRYQATAHAVPFLLELLADPATPDRAELAHLLTMLAVGYDEQWLPDTFPVERCRADAAGGEELLRAAPPVVDEWADDVDEDEDEEDRYSYYESLSDEDANALYSYVVLAAYDAVRAGVPLFRSLVAGDDPALRTAAAYALAWFPEDAAVSLAALAPATVPAGEHPASLLAAGCALVALGLLGGSAEEVAAATAALADDRELVRWGAAVALASLQGPDVGREAVAELLTWAGGAAGERDDVPFLRGDIGGVAVLALRHLGDAHADVVFDALLSRLGAVSGMPAVTVLYEVLRRGWPDGKHPADTPFATLSPSQQRVVRLLADSPSTWRYRDLDGLFGNFTMLLRQYNLPRTPEEMQTYITTPITTP